MPELHEPLILEKYLPFTRQQLQSHFILIDGDPEKYLSYYMKSAARYKDLLERVPKRKGMSITQLKFPAQVEKDERFWVVSSLMSFYYHHEPATHLARLCRLVFGDKPPVSGVDTWEACLEGELRLYFEVSLPSPDSYKTWLQKNIHERQIIPYIIDAAHEKNGLNIKKNLEGPTHLDALLLNVDNGFALAFEAKVLSDISYQVSYDSTRNQIARNIDVLLEKNKDLHPPLNIRDPDKTCFLLFTPELFRKKWHSRLYGWQLKEYQNDPRSLARDVPHRHGINWPEISARLGWLTYEDCRKVLPGSCPWLSTE